MLILGLAKTCPPFKKSNKTNINMLAKNIGQNANSKNKVQINDDKLMKGSITKRTDGNSIISPTILTIITHSFLKKTLLRFLFFSLITFYFV